LRQALSQCWTSRPFLAPGRAFLSARRGYSGFENRKALVRLSYDSFLMDKASDG
jgi:hypothetical protein